MSKEQPDRKRNLFREVISGKIVSCCSACLKVLPKKQQGLCNDCRKAVASLISGSGSPVFCRKCQRFATLNEFRHGVGIAASAKSNKPGKAGLVVYDDFSGCPDCADELMDDRPHPIIIRIPLPNQEGAA